MESFVTFDWFYLLTKQTRLSLVAVDEPTRCLDHCRVKSGVNRVSGESPSALLRANEYIVERNQVSSLIFLFELADLVSMNFSVNRKLLVIMREFDRLLFLTSS